MENNIRSYELHAKTYSDSDVEKIKQWAKEDTVDYWRHKRMFDTLLPILHNYPNAKWLTVGDGKYGTDAHYLLKHTPNVVASDIADECLKPAKESGYITEYKVENAENISYGNESFDFVFCKEAYHHFPRPSIAVYEMLRVAKKAIILIEPNDPNSQIPQKFTVRQAFFWLIQSLKNVLKKLAGKEPYYEPGGYEPIGNYIYAISEREIEKIALGMNYDMVAFKGINDEYIEGVEFELLEEKGPKYRALKKIIETEDRKVRSGKRAYSLLTAMIFKEMPNEACIREMKENGFIVTRLTKNPYL